MDRFSFLQDVLHERRSYDYSVGHVEMIETEMARLAAAYPDEPLPKLEVGPIGHWNQPSLTVSHAFMPARSGAQIIEKAFNISLPEDFTEFYNRWNEGLLLGRNPIKIMSPDYILSETLDIRSAQSIPSSVPFHTIRFGELTSYFHFLLRFSVPVANWVVDLVASNEFRDTEIQSHGCDRAFTDLIFTEWLKRMIDTDGAPLHSAFPDNEDDYFNKRVK